MGVAIARRLAAQGADLLLQGWERHDAERHNEMGTGAPASIVDELREAGRRVEYVSADFSDPLAPAEVVQAGIDAFGHLDILVANHARTTPRSSLAEITAAEIDASYAINSRSTFLLVKEFAGHFKGSDGRIVLFTSGQHNGPMADEIPYAASKAALAGMTPSLAAAVISQRIMVNCVNPGPTDTGWATPDITAAALTRLRLGRWGTPDDAAALVSFLVGPDGGWVTGQVISSEGGFNLG
ncbi:SDR family oxidoreductase [Fodinicola feengrottensis]|uniref:SDR family oxidoreductase n=1 Tax=Fodinicola feengrottensis TaxID=435914 RepID=UPI0028BDF112|nr:SDR family oxidoreductase [Fodinicola feengrottensis]